MSITRIVHVVNRTLDPLEVMDDGVPWVIRPGYKLQPRLDGKGQPVLSAETGEPEMEVVGSGPGGEVLMEPLPYWAAERAIRQNPVMGTEDPYQPQDFKSLIACPTWPGRDDVSFCQQSNAIERLDRSLLPEEVQSASKVIAGAGRRNLVKKRDPLTGRFKMVDPNGRSVAMGLTQTINPAGIVTRVDG